MDPRPTGTVTFLFTDIEGSTQLWEHHAAWMAAAHRRHEAILWQAIAAHGGWAYKQIGDAFQAAFQTAPAALAAALDAQRALAAEAWPTPTPLRVRMALHTGTTEERDDDYVGPLLNRVARLMAAGHGGQVLLTQAAYDAAGAQLPTGVTLRDLGERRLKDLIRPEHVWQALAADLPDEFPPLHTLDSRPNNLPRQTTALIGRESEVAAVAALLRQGGTALVTLTGPGGIGKTRLALQVAADLLDDFADGVWFVELAALTDPTGVPGTIAATLGIKEQGSTPILDTLAGALKEKRLLLVLDNFEQVAAAAPAVSALLRAAPGVRLLVTSRVPLHVYGEKEYAVPPLAAPDPNRLPPLEQVTQYEAVRLFSARAQDARADFAVTSANATAVAEICARLDGLPLALELAAARVKLFTLEALLGRLARRLKLLTGGSRDRAARQQTLRATIDWSYDLLTAGEQQLFQRLAVFQGGRTLEALDAVCNHDGELVLDILDGMQALVDQSLVQPRAGRDGEPRFWLLETIHEYAREKLVASGEEGALRAAHLAYFTALAEQAEPELTGPQQAVWLDRLEDEHDNLRAALAWARAAGDPAAEEGLRLAAALWRFWLVRGYFGEGRLHLTAALASSATAPAAARARALNGAGGLAYYQGDYAAARALFAESLALRRAMGDRQGVAGSLGNLGMLADSQGEYAAARALYEESLTLMREFGDQNGIANALNNLAGVALNQGDYAAARALYEESLALRRELGDQGGIAVSLGNLGAVVEEQGDYAAARVLYEESLALFQGMGNTSGIATALNSLGSVAHRQGADAAARPLFAESLALRRELGDQYGIAVCLVGLGGLLATRAPDGAGLARAARVLGAVDALLRTLGAVLDRAERLPYERAVATVRAALGDAAFAEAWAAGQALSLEAAIAEARAEET